MLFHCTLSFKSNTFIGNVRLKLAKNQADAKQHSETELKVIYFLHQSDHPRIRGDILKHMRLYD